MTPTLHFTQFGKYEIIRKLGRSMTDVYLALDPETNRRVILKIVEQCKDSLTQLIVDAERRGAAIQQQLHAVDARILEVYEFGDQNGCFFLAMQYAEGRSLAEVIRKDTRLDGARAARYGAEICSQLQTLHTFQTEIDGQRRAVVHGDIKPSNIQIGPHDEVYLLDFGIAKAITATRNLTQHNLGSPAYCSPERLKNGSVDPFADLWAVGVCLYEMVSGIPPYQAQTTRKLENLIQSRRPPRALPGDCPEPLRNIIWKALASDSARRYPSASALEQDLRAYLQRKPTAAANEREPAWDSNATLERSRTGAPPPTAPRHEPTQRRKLTRALAEFNVVVWSLIAGLIIGLLCFLPASHVYRYWSDSAPLRAARAYTNSAAARMDADARLYKRLQQTYAYLGRFSPVPALSEPLRYRLTAAGNEVVDSYRDSADPDVARLDWEQARTAFSRALELDPSSAELKGKLALAEGYLKLGPDTHGAMAKFQESAALLPKSPDPHLAMARVYVYNVHNVGLAFAEFHAAERAGYKLGPREFEQQADGYLYRAEQEYRQWQRAKTLPDQRRNLMLMDRDFDRARTLYEPIAGFSNVSHSLERLETDQSSAEQSRQNREHERERARLEAQRRKAKYRRWR